MNDVSKLLEWLSNLDQYKSTEKGLHRKPQIKSLKKAFHLHVIYLVRPILTISQVKSH